jgi:hypothetical protein
VRLKATPIDYGWNTFLEAAPRVSKVYLAEYIGRIHDVDKTPLADLILEALRRLPENKRVRYKKHRLVLISIGCLLEQIPDADGRKAEIMHLFLKACSRL